MADPVSVGITVALTLGQMALTASRKIEGPRVKDRGYTGGDYGAPLIRGWGMPRVHPPVFFAEDLKEVKRRRKTKGGKYNDYTYYATFAFAIAGHQIDAVRRIWLDGHLVFDLSGAGPVTPFDLSSAPSGGKGGGGGGGHVNFGEVLSIYLGTPTQEPDPRIQLTTEAKHGEGSCSAYRDTAYAVVKDLPVEKFGNRFPQPIVEFVNNPEATYPYEKLEFASGTGTISLSADRATILTCGPSGFSLTDVAARSKILSVPRDPSGHTSATIDGISADGTVLSISSSASGGDLYRYDQSGFGVLDTSLTNAGGSVVLIEDSNGLEHWMADRLGNGFYFDGGLYEDAPDGATVQGSMIFATSSGQVWHVGRVGSTTVNFWLMSGTPDGPQSFSVSDLTSTTGNPFAFHYEDGEVDHFVLGYGEDLYLVDRQSGTVTATYTPLHDNGIRIATFHAIVPSAKTFWIGFEEISSKTLAQVRSLDREDWAIPTMIGSNLRTIYDPISHALVTSGTASVIWHYLDRVGAGSTTLGTIVADVSADAGIDPSEIDVTTLTQPIYEYAVAGGTGKDWLEPILDIHDSDGRPHDFTLQFLRRGYASGATIEHGVFAQPRDESPLYETPGAGGSDLPALVTMQFADIDADHQPALANSGPLGEVDSERIVQLDMSNLGLNTDEAHQLVARWHRRRWFEKQPYGVSLSMQHIELEPCDVHPLLLPDDRLVTGRLTSMVLGADRTITCEWRPDDTSLAAIDGESGATYDGRTDSVIAVPLLSKGFVLDTSLIADEHDAAAPQVYPQAAPLADGTWPGAIIYQGIDGEYSEELASKASVDASTWGYVEELLPWANPNVWDRGTEITVTLQTGELTGCTEAAALADPTLNLALIGADGRWEQVQFTVATLIAPLTYTLSGFRRGRRGTEWAAGLHAAGDVFVLWDGAVPIAMGLSEVGTDVTFKAITAGRTTGFRFGYTYGGQSLKPYAPVHLEAVKESNGDWTFTWVRRTRVGGAWTGGSTIPLGEASEEYELTLRDGVTTVTKSPTIPTYTWTVADQTTDTGAEVLEADLEWSVAQVSDAVGAGFVATP